MAISVEFSLPPAEFVLARSVEQVPGFRIDAERIVFDSIQRVTPYSFVVVDDFAAFEEALAGYYVAVTSRYGRDHPMSLRWWQVPSTLAIVVLSAASSLTGLLRPGHYADARELLARTRAEDLAILAIAVPVLAVSLWYASRGSLRGRFVWLGALAFMAYAWASRSLSLAFNDFFLGYVVLLTLSLFTLAAGVVETDADATRRGLAGRLSERVYAAALAVISTGLALLWLSDVFPASLAGRTPAIVEEFGLRGLGTVVVDLGLVVPSLAVAAAWLWQGRPWGYVVAGVLLVFVALLAPVLAAITIVDLQTGVTMTPGLVVGTVVPPLVAAAFAVRYLLAIPAGQSASEE